MGVTIYELVAPLLILARRFVSLACLGHIGILALGLWMVHRPEGWFVVGGGRNGMEYSVLADRLPRGCCLGASPQQTHLPSRRPDALPPTHPMLDRRGEKAGR